jgi:L-ascorbate metabolism protein UlaG (beta-lactamase superfamily)
MPVTITWTGHATFLIDTGDGTLLVDPFFDDCPTASLKAADVACDAILITHAHFDHLADAAAIAKRTGATVFAAFEIANWLGTQGVTNVQPMNHGGTAAVPGGTARMEIAFHSSSLPDGSYGGNPAGWLLDVGGKRVYVAGDTSVFSDMERIGRARDGRGLDLAILPIGDLFTMGPEQSLEAIRLLTPKHVLPCHYNTWPPIAQDAAAWAESVRRDTDAEPCVLAAGEAFTLE